MTTVPENLQGWQPDWSTPAARLQALTAAVDYRGDVTMLLADGEELVGYVFNVSCDTEGQPRIISLYPKDEALPREINAQAVQALTFTGKDTAEGKSWDAWLAKVAEAEASGRIAELYPEEHAE